MGGFWSWVEEDDEGEVGEPLELRPILNMVHSRAFPPVFHRTGVDFQRYDPDIPEFRYEAGPGDASTAFNIYNATAGWNGDMSRSAAIAIEDTSFDPEHGGHTPRLSAFDTSSDDLADWAVLPEFFPWPYGNAWEARFIPGTQVVSVLAYVDGDKKLLGIDTNTMTKVMEVSQADLTGDDGDILHYYYSFDGTMLALTFSRNFEETRVYSRSGVLPAAELSAGVNIFGTRHPHGMFFSQDTKWLLGYDYAGHVVNKGVPPFNTEIIFNMSLNPGEYADGALTWHPESQYFVRSGRITVAFDNDLVRNPLFTFEGEVVDPDVGGPYGDFDPWGTSWLGTDGGRDPYGGFAGITTVPGLLSDGQSLQWAGDFRLAPYH